MAHQRIIRSERDLRLIQRIDYIETTVGRSQNLTPYDMSFHP